MNTASLVVEDPVAERAPAGTALGRIRREVGGDGPRPRLAPSGLRPGEQPSAPPGPGSNTLGRTPSAPRDDDPPGFIGGVVLAEQLSVVFQPIVSLDDGSTFAVEALVRCSTQGYSNPEVLFSAAVQHGAAGRLGRMIREGATSLYRRVPIFLNVHPQELNEPWLVRPDDPIHTHGADVYLEITEAVPFAHFQLCQSVLSEMRWRGGVHVVVDDLGAGYSNLKRIADLEPKVVKLDRELTRELHTSVRQQKLVANVVRLCVDMGASVVAEGIETEHELAAVQDAGVHYGQGYLLARPAFPVPPVSWAGGSGRGRGA